jgi:hypothetical protein
MNFYGTGTPLSQRSLDEATSIAQVDLPELWSVIHVETSGCGYLPDRRPKILFERHIFSRLTHRRYDESHPEVSAHTAGGYGHDGAHQYTRLEIALQLNGDAALKSASWGLGQIMGENFREAGFTSIEDMVAAMVDREDNQLQAMASFLHATGMDDSLRSHDWASFAEKYNGPNYAENNYDRQLAQSYEVYSSGPLPNLEIRAVQIVLGYKGFDPGPPDGVVGKQTRAAISQYQSARELPVSGEIDAGLLASLGL